jgi:hypothetical protein
VGVSGLGGLERVEDELAEVAAGCCGLFQAAEALMVVDKEGVPGAISETSHRVDQLANGELGTGVTSRLHD